MKTNRVKTKLLLAGAALVAVACAAKAEPVAEPSLYASQIAPLLESNCAVCHMTGEEAGGMSLVGDTARGFLVDQPSQEAPTIKRVVPGDPDASYIVMKLEGTHIDHGGSGAQMPFGGAPLPAEQIALVRQWIKDGAHP
ncbi:c-type cytochrome [Novosphingobium sp.]|uniref:c-type cytochrome n=1 Tax=Novosphingobium sp. TaxID=1874826 RepID=UPI0038BA9631